ncbi:endothelin-converting enzyme 2 [Mayamaea pseudoterrestris]|nr:endothelin-converting enzyme 2 [Mayamaea pseudoterrestris]
MKQPMKDDGHCNSCLPNSARIVILSDIIMTNDADSSRQISSELVLPKQNCDYNSLHYWEDRFSKEPNYEWLLSYQQLQATLSKYLCKPSCRILIVGCGNAPFSKDLYDAGYENIVNIDYSSVVVHAMRQQHAMLRPKMEWLVMDMTNLTFEDASFDVVIDKAAFDAMLADEGDVWKPNHSSIDAGYDACRSISRVLTPNGGVFLQISLVQPHFRKKYLLGWHQSQDSNVLEESYAKEFAWSLQIQSATEEAENSFGHFLYVMTKQDKANEPI